MGQRSGLPLAQASSDAATNGYRAIHDHWVDAEQRYAAWVGERIALNKPPTYRQQVAWLVMNAPDVAAELFMGHLRRAKSDEKAFQNLLDRSEGAVRRNVDLTSDGKAIKTYEVVDPAVVVFKEPVDE